MSERHERPGFMCWFEDAEMWAEFLNDQELGQLIRAVIMYAKNETEDTSAAMPKHVEIMFTRYKRKLKKDKERYNAVIEKRVKAGKARARNMKVSNSQDESSNNHDIIENNDGSEEAHATTCLSNADTCLHMVANHQPSTINRQPSFINPQSSSSVSEIEKYWETVWGKAATTREVEAFNKMVNEGYGLEDIRDALRKAHQNADDNPAGYMLTILKDWKEHGKPKRPHESRELMQRHSDEDRKATYQAAIIDLDEEEP